MIALAAHPAHASAPRCAEAARERAGKLLAFHAEAPPDPGGAIEVDKSVAELPSLKNPAAPDQRIEVLEVWGYVDKAQYRMRFLFAPVPDVCALVGEEIIEYGRF